MPQPVLGWYFPCHTPMAPTMSSVPSLVLDNQPVLSAPIWKEDFVEGT